MRQKKIFSVAVGILILLKTGAQDAQFSQFYSSPLYLSPSLTGAAEKARLNTNYRNQWINLPNAYVDYAFSFDHFLYDYNSGIGVMVVRNQEGGVYNTTTMGLSYSYVINVNHELKIRPGLRAGYYLRNIDYAKIQFADQITRDAFSSIELVSNENIKHYDFSTSVFTYTSKFWLGFTGDHLLALNKQLRNDDTYPSLKLSLYGGTQFKLFESVISKEDKIIYLSFFYKNQAGFHQLDLGTYYEEAPFRIGLWFRGVPVFENDADLNAIVIMAGYTYKDFLINYSYDISTSHLLASTGGAHEVSMSYLFNLNWGGKSNKPGAVPCPKF